MHLNRNYRILWSEARRAWVVADELAGTGGKSGGCRMEILSPKRFALIRGWKPLLQAALVATGMLTSAPPDASALSGICGTGTAVNISAVLSGTCTASATDTITLTNTGSIQSSTSSAINVLGSTGVTIDNGGQIRSQSSNLPTIFAMPSAVGTNLLNRTGANITNSVAALNNTGILFNNFDTQTTLTNNGTIKSSPPTGGFVRNARGIASGADLAGTLINSGLLTASAVNKNSTSARARGIMLVGGLSGSLSNSNTGTISASATLNGNTSTSLRNTAWGIQNNGTLTGSLTNDGTITAIVTNNANNTSSSTASVQAFGIIASSTAPGVTGSVTNTGTITASATNAGNGGTFGGNINVQAAGVQSNIGISGTMSNSNTITATAVNSGLASGTTVVNAVGIAARTLTGTLTNTGTVSTRVTNNGSGNPNVLSATGISFNLDTGGILNNSGTVSATSSRGAAFGYSLKDAPGFPFAGGVVNNMTGGLLRGNININANANVTFNNAGTVEIPDGVTTANIAGNYTQQTGGMLRVGASSTASFGKLTVGGTADLTGSGAFDVNVAGPATLTLAAGQKLPGVLTAGVLTAPAVSVTDNSPLIDFTAAANLAGTGVDLTVTPPAIPGVALDLNGAAPFAFNSTTNKTMTLTAGTAASTAPANADVYVALQLPNRTLLVVQPNGSFGTALTPLVSNISVPDFKGPVFTFTFTGAEPPGNYTWFAALTTPGSLNVIGTLVTASFSFAP